MLKQAMGAEPGELISGSAQDVLDVARQGFLDGFAMVAALVDDPMLRAHKRALVTEEQRQAAIEAIYTALRNDPGGYGHVEKEPYGLVCIDADICLGELVDALIALGWRPAPVVDDPARIPASLEALAAYFDAQADMHDAECERLHGSSLIKAALEMARAEAIRSAAEAVREFGGADG